jgi:hypothetical protein
MTIYLYLRTQNTQSLINVASSRAASPANSFTSIQSIQFTGMEEDHQDMVTDKVGGHKNGTFESDETLISPIESIVDHKPVDGSISGVEFSTSVTGPTLTAIATN